MFTAAGHSANYLELACADVWDQPVDPVHVQSAHARLDLMGHTPAATPVRPDVAAKVLGEFEFIHDRVLPGMCHGLVFRPGTLTAHVIERDMLALQSALQATSGVLKVVRNGLLLGVMTETEHVLTQIARKVEDDATQGRIWRCQAEVPDLQDLPNWLKAQPLDSTVIVDTACELAGSGDLQRVSAEFHRPFLQHASIGLCCALAQWSEPQLEVWSHSQGIYNLRRDLSLAFDLATEQVHVSHVEGAGCYGHKPNWATRLWHPPWRCASKPFWTPTVNWSNGRKLFGAKATAHDPAGAKHPLYWVPGKPQTPHR
jgi:hypothetical protein